MNEAQLRFNMIEQQIKTWNVFDKSLLKVIMQIKRENFVDYQYKALAYSEVQIPLPNGEKMLIPQVEARVAQALELTKQDKVLQIGTGSGYLTAIIATLAAFVYSLEINEQNKQSAVNNLTKIGITNVTVTVANGINGYISKSPYDKILVGGACHKISDNLKQQLAIGGKLVGFVGNRPILHAVVIDRVSEHSYVERQLFETDIEYLITENVSEFNF